MGLVLKDRVKETTTTTGTGTLTLAGAAFGFQSFSAIGNANTTYYAIEDTATGAWEVGVGTYTSAGGTLSRDTVIASSNAGSLVSFGAGTKNVYVTLPASIIQQKLTPGVVQTASGTSVNFTGIPSWATRITIIFNGVGTSGTSNKLVRLGSGSIATTGYNGVGSYNGATNGSSAYTNGLGINSANAAEVLTGNIVITNISGNTWVANSMLCGTGGAGNYMLMSSSNITLSGVLDRLSITTVNGTDTFDAGTINIMWE